MVFLRSVGLVLLSFLFVQTYAQGKVYRPSDLSFRGFIKIDSKKEVYADVQKAKLKKPTIILLNGLTYSTGDWDAFAAPLLKEGYGVVRYDMMGMGETLLKYAPVLEMISYQQQVEDLKNLLEALELPTPYNIAGLSYGGAIAEAFAQKYPDLVKNVIMMAPYVGPLQQQDEWIKSQIWYTRRTMPWNTASDDDLYDYFLKQIIYTTYPAAEPKSVKNSFSLEGIFRMVQSVRKFNGVATAQEMPDHSVHLMIAVNDQYIKTEVHDEFWEALSSSSRLSRIYVHDSEHKMVEAVPMFTSAWVKEILDGNKNLTRGYDFHGFPRSGEAKGPNGIVIKTPKD